MTDDLYSNVMAKIAGVYVDRYRKDKDLAFLNNTSVGRKVLKDMYNKLVKEGSIEAIENLPETRKRELYNECKMYDDPLNLCRVLHTIKNIS